MTPDTLLEVCIRTARSGNTTKLVEVASEMSATIVALDMRHELELKRRGAFARSVEAGRRAFTATGPYVVDLAVVAMAAQQWSSDRAARASAERELGWTRDELGQVRAEREATAAALDAARAEIATLRAQLQGAS